MKIYQAPVDAGERLERTPLRTYATAQWVLKDSLEVTGLEWEHSVELYFLSLSLYVNEWSDEVTTLWFCHMRMGGALGILPSHPGREWLRPLDVELKLVKVRPIMRRLRKSEKG